MEGKKDLVRGKKNEKRLKRVVNMKVMVEVLKDRFKNERMLEIEKIMMERIIRNGKIGIRVKENEIWVKIREVDEDIRGFSMRIKIIRISEGIVNEDGKKEVRRNKIIKKEGGLRNNRKKKRIIKEKSEVIEKKMEMEVIINIRIDIVGEMKENEEKL